MEETKEEFETQGIKEAFDTQEMFNLLFRLITLEESLELVSTEELSKLFLYLILIKEKLE